MSRKEEFHTSAFQLPMFVRAGDLADTSVYESTDLPDMVRSPIYPMVNNIEQAKRAKVKETLTMGLLPPVTDPETQKRDPSPDGFLGARLPKRGDYKKRSSTGPRAERSMYADIKEKGVTTPVPVQINPSDMPGISPFILSNGNHRVYAAAHINPDMLVPVTWENAPEWDESMRSPAGGLVPANGSHRNSIKEHTARAERLKSKRKARDKQARKQAKRAGKGSIQQ